MNFKIEKKSLHTTEFNFIQEIYTTYYVLLKEKELRKRIIRDHVAQQQEKELRKRIIRDHVAQQQVEQKERRINNGN